MAKLFDFSQLNPIKLYFQSDVFHSQNENLAVHNPNYNHRHMDNDFFARNLKSWQNKVKYYQPFQNGDSINLMWLGVSTNNYTAYLVDCNGNEVAQFAPISPASLGSDKIYLLNIPLWNINEGIYFVQLKYANSSTLKNTYMISEPIDVKQFHENTLQFNYKNSFNDQHVIWSYDSFEMIFRVHASFTEMNPQNKSVVYENEPLNPTLVSAIPYREWVLNIGYTGMQVPEWLIDKLERIFSCDTLQIDGKYFTRKENSQFSPKRIEGHPLSNFEIIVRENENRNDTEINDATFITLGLVPTTDIFYIKGFYSSTTSTYIATLFETYFKGQTSFVNYLNQIYLPSIHIYDDSFFAIDENNKLVLSSSNATLINSFTSLQVQLNGILPYCIHVESLKSSGSTSIDIDLTNTGTAYYAIVANDTSQINYSSYPGALSQTINYTPNKVHRTYFFFSAAEVIILLSNQSIYSIAGNLPNNCKKLDVSNNIINTIKNNLFLTCTGVMSTINFYQNKLSYNEVDKLLLYLYEAYLNNSLKISGSNYFNSDNQSPLAPPSSNIGISTFISTLAQNNWIITTD